MLNSTRIVLGSVPDTITDCYSRSRLGAAVFEIRAGNWKTKGCENASLCVMFWWGYLVSKPMSKIA